MIKLVCQNIKHFLRVESRFARVKHRRNRRAIPRDTCPVKFTSCRSTKVCSIKGFTLIEIMIALLIFAILGVMAAISIRRIIRTHEHIKRVDNALQRLQLGFVVMQRDVAQMINRPVATGLGDKSAALIANSNSLVFTCAGWVNPLSAKKRSTLQRVAYRVMRGSLYRVTWPVLDAPLTVKPRIFLLLPHVRSMQVQFVNRFGVLVNSWAMGVTPQAVLPRAVIVTLSFGQYGSVKRVFPTSQVGTYGFV